MQEALTNVLKHAGPAKASVRIAHRSHDVELEVVDDGRGGGTGGGTGHGLVGMRERAALYGGEFEAQHLKEGGFRVWARLPCARLLRPDVVLMDVRMPAMDGIEATRRLLGAATDGPRVLVLTTFDLDEYVYEALRAGASGFMLKSAPPERIVEAIRTVAAGDALLAPEITRRLIEQFVRRPRPPGGRPPETEELTERELEVLKLIAGGQSNAEIAAGLFVSEGTVKTHVNRILRKLGLRDRVQAVVPRGSRPRSRSQGVRRVRMPHRWYDSGMPRARISTTVDAELLAKARRAGSGLADSALIDEALAALLARQRGAEIDAAYAAYDAHPLAEGDEWGHLASFRSAAGAS